ncbi:apiosidase-like domain-containing protein [Neorhizobium sp. DT-125]|uniref:apiosidase-like domain-containing protein n=1 Tax=Neorhizobium sp. DT-125 TaxID=3396163 RepID=UPI003F1B3DE3
MKRDLPYPGRGLQNIWATGYRARLVFMHFFVSFCLLFFPAASVFAQEFDFPLRSPQGGHYLEDSQGTPFLISGDSAWSLIADLSLSDAVLYLETRKRQGFNTILTSLIEHKFARNAPANSNGDAPFLGAAFETPNKAYFEKAEAIIAAASRRNLLVLLYPAYLGAGGGPEGWYQEMVNAGPEKLKAYGRYVGNLFAHYPNIIWVQGGDYNPPDKALVKAVAEGIAETAPNLLQTVHTDRDTVSSIYWHDADWLDIDTVYTYGDVADAVLTRYRSGPRRPFFFLEGKYEGEHGVNEREVRLIAYSALLSGAGGQMFGNNPIWHFSAAGLYPASETWEQALFSRGAQSLMQLGKLFGELDWWRLTPDQGLLLKAAEGGEHSRALAARDTDGSFAVIYVTDADNITIDLDSLPGGEKLLRWYDPSNGVFAENIEQLGGDPVKKVDVPDAPNSSGFHDWVAILSNNS